MRRSILLLALAAATVATACADVTAPKRDLKPDHSRKDWECRSGYMSESGYVCTDSVPT